MLQKLVVVLAVLLCVGKILTVNGQTHNDLSSEHQQLTEAVEEVEEVVEDLEDEIEDIGDEIDDIGDEIEDLEDEIEDFGEGIEGMETDVEAVAAELVNLREEVKSMRSVFETGLHPQGVGDKVEREIERLADEVSDVRNCTQTLKKDTQDLVTYTQTLSLNTQYIKEELTDMKTSVVSLENDLGARVGSLEGELQENHLEIKEELANVETTVKKLGTELGTKVDSLEGDLNMTYMYLEVKEDLTEIESAVENLESELGAKVESLEGELGEVKHYTLVLANHTEKDLGDMKEELTNMRNDLGAKVESLEGELNTKHLEVKEDLASLQRDMNSTLYILQELKNQLIDLREENSTTHQDLLPGSCSELHPNSPSGYYLLAGNSSEKVYCDMDRQSCGCGNQWGWMRVANIDMTDPSQQCPEGFRLRPATSKRMCEITGETAGCTSTVFPTHSVQYSRVCGRVKAYQYATSDAFAPYYFHRSRTIDDQYVDGVSITHGQSPRKHIWTLSAAHDETKSDIIRCPCSKNTTTYTGVVPPFIGNDYFCDTGIRQVWEYKLYSEDPLWDGEGCGPTSSCCQFNSPPWFCKELPQPSTDNIEVRVCRNERRSNEDTPFEQIELYVQ